MSAQLKPCPFCCATPLAYGPSRCMCETPDCPIAGRTVERCQWNKRTSPAVSRLVAAIEASRLSELTWENDKELKAALAAVKEEFGV